jgi:hypothetical protein
MALFGLSLKKIKEGLDLGGAVLGAGKNLFDLFNQQPQVSTPTQLPQPQAPQQPKPFDFRSTFKQPGAPALPTPSPFANLSSFSTQLPTAPTSVIENVKRVAPTLPTPAKPINAMDILKGFSTAASYAIPTTPFGQTTSGKIASQGLEEFGKGNIPGTLKSAYQGVSEAQTQINPVGQILKGNATYGIMPAPSLPGIKPLPQAEQEKNLDFLRSINQVPTNMISTIPGTLAGIATGGKAIQEPINTAIYGKEKATQIKQQQEQLIKDLYKVGGNIKEAGPVRVDKNSAQSQAGDFVGSIIQSLAIASTGPVAPFLFYQQAQGRTSLETYQNTGDINKSALAGATYGIIEAAFEKLSIGLILKPSMTGSIKGLIGNIIKKLAIEGSTEGLQQASENIIRMMFGDKSIKNWWQNVPEAVIFGGLAGGAVAGPVEISNFNLLNKQLKEIQAQTSALPTSVDFNQLSNVINNRINLDAQNIQQQLLQINPETQVGPRAATQQEQQFEQQQRQAEQQRLAQEQAAPQPTSDLMQGYQLPTQRTQTDLQGQVQDITTQFPKISPNAANRLVQQYGYDKVIAVTSEVQKSGTAKNLEAVVTSELQKRFGESNVQIAPLEQVGQETMQQAKERLNIPQTVPVQPGEVLSTQQQTLWDEKYASKIENIDNQINQLQQQLEQAKGKDKVNIQNKINVLNKQSAQLENQFINESKNIPGVKPEPTLQETQSQSKPQSINNDLGQTAEQDTVKHEIQKSIDTIKTDVGTLLSDIDQQPFTFEEMAQEIQRASRDSKYKPKPEIVQYYGKIKEWLDAWADYAGLDIKTQKYYLPQFRSDYVYNYDQLLNDATFNLDTLDFSFAKKRENKLDLNDLNYTTEGLVRYAVQAKAWAKRHDIRAEQLMQEQELENAALVEAGVEPNQIMTREEAVNAAIAEEDLVKTIQGLGNSTAFNKEVKKAKTVEDITKPSNVSILDPDLTLSKNEEIAILDRLPILDKFYELGAKRKVVQVENDTNLNQVREKLSSGFEVYKDIKFESYFLNQSVSMWEGLGFDIIMEAPATAVNIREEAQVKEILQSKTKRELIFDITQYYLNKAANPDQHTAELNNPDTQNAIYQIYRNIVNTGDQYNEKTLLWGYSKANILNNSADYAIYQIAKKVANVVWSDEFIVGTWDNVQTREGFRADENATFNKAAVIAGSLPNNQVTDEDLKRINLALDFVFRKMQITMGKRILTRELQHTRFTDPTLRKTLTKDVGRIMRDDNITRNGLDKITENATNIIHLGALGLNFESALFNPLETKQIYALFGRQTYFDAIKKATQPGGFNIVDKYGVDATRGYNLEGYNDFLKERGREQIEKSKYEKFSDGLLFMFNQSERWKDAVMLHAFEAQGKAKGLKQQDLIRYVVSNFNKYGLKYGQFGSLGINKTRTGKIAFQFMQYGIKNTKLFGNAIFSRGNMTTQERKAANAYLRRIAGFNVIAYLLLSRLIGVGWEQIVGFFNPISARKSQVAAVSDSFGSNVWDTLMKLPTGPALGLLLNFIDALVAEGLQAEDQQREYEFKKVWSPTMQRQAAILFPAGVQLFNKTGVQALIPGGTEYLEQGAIADMQRGYNISKKGQARFEAPTDIIDQTRALLFGPFRTSKADEYFGQSPVFGVLPGDLRSIPGVGQALNALDQGGTKYRPIPQNLQEELAAGKYTPEEAIRIGRNIDSMYRNAFEPKPSDLPSERKRKEELKRFNDRINATTYNPATGKRESDVLSNEKWDIVQADRSLDLFNFYKEKSKVYAKVYGYSIDPIYELTNEEQIRQVLSIRAGKTGEKIEMQEILRATEPWYREFEKKNLEYGRQVAASGIEPGDEYGFSARKQAYLDLKPPQNTQLMDQYYNIKNKDAAAGKAFFKANAEQLAADFDNYRKQKFAYYNAKRKLEGVAPIPESVYNNVTFGYEEDEKKVFYELYYQKGFGKKGTGYTKRFYQPAINRTIRAPKTSVMRTGMGRQIKLRPGRVVVRQNPM